MVNALLKAARAAQVLPALLMLGKSYSSLRVSVESGPLDGVKALLGAQDAGVLSELLMCDSERPLWRHLPLDCEPDRA